MVGFAGAFRRSELVAIRCEDITEHANGLEILIRRSKTDQAGAGRTVFIPGAKGARCPVKALRQWLALAGIEAARVFRAVTYETTGAFVHELFIAVRSALRFSESSIRLIMNAVLPAPLIEAPI
ncbi:hypothetical protein CS8_010730 [Cupriavidus sp. 8B]